MIKQANGSTLVVALVVLLQADALHADVRVPKTGPWRAWLESPGGELPFDMTIERTGEDWRATIINGQEQIDVPVVSWDGAELTLDIDYYRSMIKATVSPDGIRLHG